jgi:hypothetical protein
MMPNGNLRGEFAAAHFAIDPVKAVQHPRDP